MMCAVSNRYPWNQLLADKTNFSFCTLNVKAMRGRSSEVVEMLTRRIADLCCIQESRGRGGSVRMVSGKDSIYKLFWVGKTDGNGGVGILLKEI